METECMGNVLWKSSLQIGFTRYCKYFIHYIVFCPKNCLQYSIYTILTLLRNILLAYWLYEFRFQISISLTVSLNYYHQIQLGKYFITCWWFQFRGCESLAKNRKFNFVPISPQQHFTLIIIFKPDEMRSTRTTWFIYWQKTT